VSAGLPYRDTKPKGAADFYFAVNALFAFILRTRGEDGLVKYWRDLGSGYYAPVSKMWKNGGLRGVADYWRSFFEAEPGGRVTVTLGEDHVAVEVAECPAITHLRSHGREIVPGFCRHCWFVSDAIGESAGIAVRIEGGNGSCRQTFMHRTDEIPPQDFDRIESAR
jgi:hypothetical protein